MQAGREYLLGYETAEQHRLVDQARHWRPLIGDGTRLAPGARLLEVGCGVGAVLGVLGQDHPGVELHGVDIEPRQLEFARRHLARSGVEATLHEGDALALPFPAGSFDHVWMMWVLEHLADPVAALREARRVLAPGGAITAIEADYSTIRTEPSTPSIEALVEAVVAAMAGAGWSDAGTRLPGWLRAAGFAGVDEGERSMWFDGTEMETQVGYAVESFEPILAPGTPEGPATERLRAGLDELRALPARPGAGIGWVIHKSTATRPAGSAPSST